MTVLVARILPAVLRALHDEHDLFLITSVATGLALAGIGAVVFGVPLALAAFVGGLAVTDSREAAEARRRLLPFRDVFAVLFFVAIGTLVDPSRLVEGLPWLALLLALIVVAKVVVSWGLVKVSRLQVRPSQLAVGLGQMGEFSFVLASAALAAGAIDAVLYVEVIAAVAVSIAVAPSPCAMCRRVPSASHRRARGRSRQSAGRRLKEDPMIRGKLSTPRSSPPWLVPGTARRC